MDELKYEAVPQTDEEIEQWIRKHVELVLGTDGAKEWMHTPNEHLNFSTPEEVIASGNLKKLHSYVTGLLDGSYY